MANFDYNIIKHIGTFSNMEGSSWNKELNIVQWGNNEPKYDLRSWSEDHSKMGKGIALSEEELGELRQLLNDYFTNRAIDKKASDTYNSESEKMSNDLDDIGEDLFL